jgi:hypothetical protein
MENIPKASKFRTDIFFNIQKALTQNILYAANCKYDCDTDVTYGRVAEGWAVLNIVLYLWMQ